MTQTAQTREEKLAAAKRTVEAIAVERWEHAHPDRMPTPAEASAMLAEIAAQYYKPSAQYLKPCT